MIVSSAAAVALLGLAGCSRGKPAFKGVDITGADYAGALALPDGDGRVRTLAEFKGKALVVFFGYTQCPDVCPTTLAEVAEARKRLGADGARVQPIFVSLDPERDTAEVLKAYVKSFGDDVIGLRGSAEQIAAAAKHFKVFFSKVAGQTPTSYTIDHSAAAYLFDPQGRVRVFARYGSGPEALAADLKLLIDGA